MTFPDSTREVFERNYAPCMSAEDSALIFRRWQNGRYFESEVQVRYEGWQAAMEHIQAGCRGGAIHLETAETRMDAGPAVVADRCWSKENLQAMPVSEKPAGAAGVPKIAGKKGDQP